jgi:hypothetical protein
MSGASLFQRLMEPLDFRITPNKFGEATCDGGL